MATTRNILFGENKMTIFLYIFIFLLILVFLTACYKRRHTRKKELRMMTDPNYRHQFLYNPDLEAREGEPLFGSNALYAHQFAPGVSVPNFAAAASSFAFPPTIPRPQSTIPAPAALRPSLFSRLARPFVSLLRRNSTEPEFEMQSLRPHDRSVNAMIPGHRGILYALEGGHGHNTLDISNVEYFFGTSSNSRPQTSSTNESHSTARFTETSGFSNTNETISDSLFRSSTTDTAPTSPERGDDWPLRAEPQRSSQSTEAVALFSRASTGDEPKIVITDEENGHSRLSSWGHSYPPVFRPASAPSTTSISSAITPSTFLQVPAGAGSMLGRPERAIVHSSRPSRRTFEPSDDVDITSRYPETTYEAFLESVGLPSRSATPTERNGWRRSNPTFAVGPGRRFVLDATALPAEEQPENVERSSRSSSLRRSLWRKLSRNPTC